MLGLSFGLLIFLDSFYNVSKLLFFIVVLLLLLMQYSFEDGMLTGYQVWDMYEGLNMCNMSYHYSHVTALNSWVH